MRKLVLACVLVLAGLLLAQAQQPTPPRYERPVHPGGPGPNRLVVDLPLLAGGNPFTVVERLEGVGTPDSSVLAHGSTPVPHGSSLEAHRSTLAAIAQDGLSDLRLYDQDGREVSYLLVPPPARAPEWAAGDVRPVAATKKTSGFEVDLHTPRLVNSVSISGLRGPYLKRAGLEGSGDRSHWTVLQEETTVFDLPDDKLTRTEIDFAAGEYRYLRVMWDDSSSARLALPRAARARLVASAATPAPLRAPLVFERRASEPGISRYRLSLPGNRLPLVAIDLSVSGGYVLRRARVTESRLAGSQMAPVHLGTAVLRRAVRGDGAADDLRVPLSPPQENRLELIVEDGNNPPLQLTGITAIFAELPWIYFEAESKADLVAKFGAPKAAAPRYDLEAARPSLPRIRPAEATWGDRVDHAPNVAPAPAGAMAAVGAVLDASAFRYRRPVPSGPRGLTALKLDAEALAKSRLSDLRLVTPDGHQVPYLVERLDEPLDVELGTVERASGGPAASGTAPGTRSSYRLRLPESDLPTARLVLETSARVFTRTVRVFEERDDPRTREGHAFAEVAASSWSHNEPETPAPPLALTLPDRLPAALWVVVDEGDNSPLPLGTPRLLLPAIQLRFFRETDEPLALLYGNPSAAPPRYDLALLAPRLVGAPAYDITAGPEGTTTASGTSRFTPTRVFWGALIAAVVILLAILGRLLRT